MLLLLILYDDGTESTNGSYGCHLSRGTRHDPSSNLTINGMFGWDILFVVVVVGISTAAAATSF